MSTHKGISFGRVFFGITSMVALTGAMGCASFGGVEGQEALGVTMAQGAEGPHVRAVAARVVDSHVNPMMPVHLTAEGGEIAVRFAHSRTSGAVVHLDHDSLAPVGGESPAPPEHSAPPSTNPARVVLGDGRFIVCWKSGSGERGYRVMAQAWTRGGDRLGAPVAVSPADADVLGTPQMVSVDGNHAVATFAAVNDNRTELLAVELRVL